MKNKEKMKKGTLKTKKRKEVIAPKGKPDDPKSGDIPVPHFKRGKAESVKAYMQRMENETQHVLFLTKNQIDRKPELEADGQDGPKDKGKSERKKEYDTSRLHKLHRKKLDRQVAQIEKERFIDTVPFGEVAMAPPFLSAKPKKAPIKSQKGPKELLLNSLLGQTVVSTTTPSMARQRIMEEERKRVVEAYRLLKKEKQKQYEARASNLDKLRNPK
ncbi:Coiled-coil domain-containing protein 137 [Liparis tanakae]|uniref:Coiled-coil domain-containing protein 137 n=1 Tax=Liparis tanakae TaxID=230148 RepID=A0A4Z2I166_9TELE|nr:Coiled-coil domain-containing protein 137 [Liparis tanakae]